MNHRPPRPILEDEIRAYEEDGVVCLEGMFDEAWCERALAATRRLLESGASSPGIPRIVTHPGSDARFYANVYMSRFDEDFRALARESPAPEIAATLMRVEAARFFYDQLFVKEPGAAAPTFWHHDLPFWPFRGDHLISLWIALTPVTRESSGVEYLLGSHRWPKFYRPRTQDDSPAFANPDLEPCPDFGERRGDPELRFRSWDLRPGDVVCHHPLTVHGAGGNASATELRAGVSIRYLGTDVQWDPRPYTLRVGQLAGIAPGEYPADDEQFPVVWPRSA
ncbi:phytanoyl-CoA dioxygenase family protein [Polyangium aurulentum]|uniref:phytanoyl-CoA dioxygenase family protein n=1 Tax=Polyangium aurulentum TaxID=2567896 RepID=UPI0010AEBFC9|nr:phytanoyl-CoA dioxygenase family protein [Polyangium aurulentum]UQA56312.1 phytanoyl-CoA dioxygenase family protein [Polyangium aurulentum]